MKREKVMSDKEGLRWVRKGKRKDKDLLDCIQQDENDVFWGDL
jgi:hypothetical protein